MTDNQKSDLKEQELQPSGSSDGVSLHIDSKTANELNLDSDTTVEVSLISEGGKPKIQLSNLPTGFTESELLEFADNKNMDLTCSDDKMVSGEAEFWGYTFRTEEDVRVSVEERTHINNQMCNNVFIESPQVEVDSLSRYQSFKEVSEKHEDLNLKIADSGGVWQRLRASVNHKTEDNPKDETMRSLLDKAEWVAISFSFVGCSLHLTLDDIEKTVDQIENALKQVN